MLINNDYKVLQKIVTNSSRTVYRAIRLIDNTKVILKVLNQQSRDAHKISQFKNERDILSTLHSNNIVKYLGSITTPSLYCNIYEDIDAITLNEHIIKSKFHFYESLNIAYTLSKTILYLHEQNIIHSDISPNNIIYNEKIKHLQLIDFGLSIKGDDILIQDRVLKTSGNLHYLSPEQTGLVQYSIDKRSDIYSLGMSLYHLFYGQKAFTYKDKDDLIHKQVIKMPKSLHQLIINFPKVLSDIIQKMILKEPSKRYQKISAVVYDLKQCIDNIDKFGDIKSFKISTADYNEPLQSTHLFGRLREIELLKKLAKSTSHQSANLIVSGASGTGKTRLIEDLLINFNSEKFFIFRIKIDQYQQQTPLYVFKQLFAQLNILVLSNSNIRNKLKLSKENIHCLLTSFPTLQEIFNFKKLRTVDSAMLSVHQLQHAIKELFNQLVSEDYHFVLFIDDVQWIDESSSELLQKTLLNIDNPYIHLISSFRKSEIHSNYNAMKLVEFFKGNTKVLNIELNNLNKKDTTNMLDDILNDKDADMEQFASIVYKKTDGNPFYIKLFIEYLHDKNILYFKDGKWNYFTHKIKNIDTTINIATILISKFEKLHVKEQEYLRYLALLGNNFKLAITLDIMNKSKLTNNIITQLIHLGFLEIFAHKYKFVHDKIQEYIFTSMREEQKRKISLNIGKYLLHLYQKNQYDDIVNITHYLNNGYIKIKLPKKLFHLNVLSLEMLLSSHSYKLALKRIVWIEENLLMHNKVTFHYEILKVQVLYKNTQLDKAYSEINKLIIKSKTMKEKIICFYLLKDICVTQGKHFAQTISFGNTLFENLGLKTPNSKSKLKSTIKALELKIKKYPIMQSPHKILQLKYTKNNTISSLLVHYWELAYFIKDKDLMIWSYFNILLDSLKKGNSSDSSFAYVLYGSYLVAQKEYTKAYKFAEIALKINHKLNDKEMLPKINNFVANFISPYKKKINTNIDLYQKSLKQSKINGDIVFGTWANFLMFFSDFLSGDSLEKLHLKINKESSFILKSGDTKMIAIFGILVNSIAALRNNSLPHNNDDNALKLFNSKKFYPALAWYAIIKAQEYFLTNQIDAGIEVLKANVHTDDNEIIMFSKIRLHFIRALLFLSKKQLLSDQENNLLLSDLNELQKIHKQSPNTFKFEKLLLKTETMKDTKEIWDVAKEYDKTINYATSLNNQFFISLANLCAARFWSNVQYRDMTNLYYNEAVVSLKKWGAFDISKNLNTFITSKSTTNTKNQHSISDTSSTTNLEPSNFNTILKSFNAISESLDSSSLIKNLLNIILQNATANKAVLILKENESYFIKSSVIFNEDKVKIITQKLDDYSVVPKDMIYYSINTGKKIILENPDNSTEFKNDIYIKKHKPSSTIVIPMKVNNEIRGVLYLQNDELQRTLSPQNIKILELLLTHTAIVLNNAMLYEEISILSQAMSQNPYSTFITDIDGNIQYANTKALSTSGYTKDELIGKNMNIFNSKQQDNDFYKSFWNKIYTNKSTFRGTIIDITKSNELIDLDSTIFPIFNNKKEIINFVAIQEDITQVNIKERMYAMQSRQAQMGEMISMIAHQWRQPLSTINAIVATQQLKVELENFELEDLIHSLKNIETQVLHLSSTIDDFRDFFKPTKIMSSIKSSQITTKAIAIIENSLRINSITLKTSIINDPEYKTFANELQQVILNILKNAQDTFLERDVQNAKIIIIITTDKDNSIITIDDNAKGIDEEVIDTLFLPYVSTRSKQNGTGLGLYMSKTIIEEHCRGILKAENINGGARFTISIPMNN